MDLIKDGEGIVLDQGCFAFPAPKLLQEQHAFFVKKEKWLNCKLAGGLPGAKTPAHNHRPLGSPLRLAQG